MIIENLMLERQQVAAYTTLVRELGEGIRRRGGSCWKSWPIPSAMPASSRIILKSTSEVRRGGARGRRWRPGHGVAAPQNPPPVVQEAQGNGFSLLAHGEPHDPCPVAGCGGTLRFLRSEVGRLWSSLQRTGTVGSRPGAQMTPGSGSARGRAPLAAPSRS